MAPSSSRSGGAMSADANMVLTGVGVVSRTGLGRARFFEAVLDPLHGNRAQDDGEGPPPGQLLAHLDIKEPRLKMTRYMDPVSRNGIVALREAMTDAGLNERDVAASPHQYAIVFGAHRGACTTRKAFRESLAARNGTLASGTLFSHCGHNIAAALAATAFGIKGPNLTIAGRGERGGALLRVARALLRGRAAHTAFVGFTECEEAPQPSKEGLGEMAYVLCLERQDRAAERGAATLAEVELHDAPAESAPPAENAVFIRASRNGPLEGAEPLSSALANVCALTRRYRSLIQLGALAHDRSVAARFPEVAFRTATGRLQTEIRMRCAREGASA